MSLAPIESRRIRDPRFLLVFPPQQVADGETIRPDGTLALPYLDAALTAAGFESRIVDLCVGTDADPLEETFGRQERISDRFVRVGMSPSRIREVVSPFDVIAVTSIFTQQTSRCFEVARIVKEAFPDKLLVAGGVNARSLHEAFLDHGFDVVFLGEGEAPIVELARSLHAGAPALAAIDGVAFRRGGRTVLRPVARVPLDLDEYAMPSWHKLPNERYWRIGRIWGGREGWIAPEAHPRYAAIFTSRGCPFRCTYCHVSNERGGGLAGDIGALRLHSVERVERELGRLRDLGVDHLFINDDSFLAKKPRVHRILRALGEHDFRLADVNGVNIVHLFTRAPSGRLVVDEALLEALHAAGFRKMSLPFESGSQRLIDAYSSSKWSLDECDVEALIGAMRRVGIHADGNFMIGYPDETLDELTQTFLLARRAMEAGLVGVGFFIVQPFPGTALFDRCLRDGQLRPDWHWDDLGWSKGSPFERPLIDKQVLKYSWSLAWRLLNPIARVEEISGQLRAR